MHDCERSSSQAAVTSYTVSHTVDYALREALTASYVMQCNQTSCALFRGYVATLKPGPVASPIRARWLHAIIVKQCTISTWAQ